MSSGATFNGETHRISGTGKSRGKFDKYQNESEIHTYYTSIDLTLWEQKEEVQDR
ncbi:hypothetical protein HOLleu_44545 [Holothuria leucospilota]|uniref:Uncharacterized protein n=1 Tax=Holothuria leucospilota TaxID=206669 RepID=A0A9Q0YFQ6_HOLLE|nr:hypothetical protein HOLleu_44545 [Holothuria leucospilota]